MKRNSWQRIVLTILLQFAVPFFTSFVLQSLWNWFVADAIHASEISYWHTVGLGLFIFLVRGWHDTDADVLKHPKIMHIFLKASVPPEKKQSTEEAIEEFENEWLTELSIEFVKIATGFAALTLGRGIHVFLM